LANGQTVITAQNSLSSLHISSHHCTFCASPQVKQSLHLAQMQIENIIGGVRRKNRPNS